jgi:hypothetical protein
MGHKTFVFYQKISIPILFTNVKKKKKKIESSIDRTSKDNFVIFFSELRPYFYLRLIRTV